ncbi:MAG TPA: hypothetical protein VK668_20655 [Mucilaginibacter sp.]|nr:hypothetical protein [Mucilaginibacter sp.]
MKTKMYLFISCILLLGSNITFAQGSSISNQSTAMLKEFYSAYSTVKFTLKDLKKIDSLQKKYCSINLRKELNEEYKANGLEHDLLTNDHGINANSLKTLTVIKNSKKINGYIVSYFNQTISATNKPILERVILHVCVTKENGSIKIVSVF